jgi:hypothetical protein
MDSLKVVKGFAGTEVQIVRSGRLIKVDLDNATKGQLELLLKMKHPAIEVIKQPPKKDPGKAK